MFNKLRAKINSLYVILSLLSLSVFTVLFPFGEPLLGYAAELTIEEEFTLNNHVGDEEVSVYVRKFRCEKVNEVKLQSFAIKAGKVTTIWDGVHTRISGAPTSSSCLFTLLSGPKFKSPWVEFSFSGGSTSSGSANPFASKKNLGADVLGAQQTFQFISPPGIDKAAKFELTEISQKAPEQMLLSREKPVLLYLQVVGKPTSLEKVLQLPKLISIQEVKDFSSQHKDLEFLAINLLWSK
jgi:hypothetical protein